MSEFLKEDVVIPAVLSQQYLVVKKQISDKQSQKDQLMKQVNQKDNEINILNKNLIAIEVKAAQMQGKEAQVKTGETTQPEGQKTAETSTTPANESFKISDLLEELNEMDQDWIFEDDLNEMGAEEFEEEGGELPGEITDEDEATDEDLNSDYIFALRINDEDEPEEIIAKVYRNEGDAFWKIRVVQGDEQPLETLQFDPDMEFLDIIEKLGEIYDDVEEIPMDEYKELLDDKAEIDAEYDWEEEPVEEKE